MQNLSSLKSLRILSIQSNRLTKIEGLEDLLSLEELYLSHNGLRVLEGLNSNLKLTTLDVSANRIEKIDKVDHLSALEEFWVRFERPCPTILVADSDDYGLPKANDNAITSIRGIEEHLGPSKCPNLNTVYLEGNPAQQSEGTAYRRKLVLALPQISQIDAT